MCNRAFKCASLALLLVAEVAAVNHGADQYGNSPGLFYILDSAVTYLVDPSSGNVLKTIPFGVPAYGDAVYTEDQAQLKHYLLVAQSANNKVTVIDTDTQSVFATVPTGKKPLHMFSVYYRDEVWIHLDGEGSFDIINLANVRYRSSSSVKDKATRIGHGKLMFHPVMEGMGYATNVNETGVQYLNVNTRKFEQKVAIFDSNYKCGGTHGVDYSPINNKIYAECSNPTKCVSPYKDPALCTGSLWTVNAATAASEARLTSPTLSAALGANFGIQGQPYHTPDSKYMFVPNKNLDILHILQPTATTTNIIEVTLPAPGNIVFFPKNSNIEYGTDSDSGNYVMAIAYKGGVAFLEMSVVVSAFEKGSLTLSEDVFTKVLTVTSDKTRTIMRGNDYVLIQEYPTLTTTDRLAVISYKTKTIESYVSVANSLKMAFVPIQTGQLKAQVAEMQAIISSSSGTTTTAASSEFTKAAFILAIIAIVLSVITLLAVSLLFTSRKRDNIKKEMESTAKTLEKA